MQGQGRDRIGALIGAVHQRFPWFRFSLDGRVDGYGDKIRFSWALGQASQADVIKGSDGATRYHLVETCAGSLFPANAETVEVLRRLDGG